MIKNPLLDLDFLKQLDESRNKIVYARIIALTYDEEPIETIEGRITGGTINIDGSSAIRRTCSSLNIVAKDINLTDYYWGLKTKFKLEIGLKSEITDEEIIWFPQGTYLITAFSTSYSTGGFNINISGQDKMCMLNGTLGGNISAPTDFANIEEVNTKYELVTFKDKSEYRANMYYIKQNDEYTISFEEFKDGVSYYTQSIERTLTPVPIKTIIREAIHTYANEPYYNIIINDVDDTGLELLEYRVENPMFFIFENKDTCSNITLNGEMLCQYFDGTNVKLKDLDVTHIYNLVDGFNEKLEPVLIGDKQYYIAKCEYGQTAGYRMTELTYAGELMGQVGDTITNVVLDKIINMLGDFQYYYNIDGQFVFERKGTYLNTSWDSLIDTQDDVYAENAAMASKVIYNFERNKLISSINHNPQLNNIKNDFSVFGEREIGNNNTVALHSRIAIDDKPEWYIAYDKTAYVAKEVIIPSALKKYNIIIRDWRELIYQMCLDFYKHNQEDDFLITIQENNTIKLDDGSIYCPYLEGKTGYEQYYIDMQGFWRQLYNPNAQATYTYKGGVYETTEQPIDSDNIEGAFTKVLTWQPSIKEWDSMSCNFFLPIAQRENEKQPKENFTDDPNLYYWNRNLLYNPELLNFWFDFLSTDGELGKYSIKAIGDRPKAVNDQDVNSIYYRTTPNVIFFDNLEEYNKYTEEYKTGYTYVILPNHVKNMFSISAQGKSAKDVIDSFLYEYTYGQESINISAIPVYYLEPNNRIYVYDQESKINGEYLVSRISIPLSYNGTMSIDAEMAPQRII